MFKLTLEFPQIIREKTASFIRPALTSLRWVLLALVLAVNIYMVSLWAPPAVKIRAQALIGRLASLPGAQAVLGAATRGDLEAGQQEALKTQLAYWQDIAGQHPDYKDAHLMVAALAYQLQEDTIAQSAVAHALAIDPNDETAQALLRLLTQAEQ